MSAGSDELFFASFVRGYVDENRRLVRRDWLAKELDAKLTELHIAEADQNVQQDIQRYITNLVAEPGCVDRTNLTLVGKGERSQRASRYACELIVR